MEELRQRGIKVLTVPEISCKLSLLQKEFYETCENFPEFRKSQEREYVLGGFCALANPMSFHNPFVRKLRQWCQAAVLPYMSYLSDGRRLEQVIDRMMLRPAGISPTRESWHRDEAPQALNDDITFGGWINLDSKSQYFSCAPGTHCKTGCNKGGFSKLGKKEVEDLLLAHPKELIEVPSGHIIIFYETILHEVLNRKFKYDSIRLFLGWRLTYSDKPLYVSNIEATKTFGVIRLKSGQIPPMYSVMHWTNWVEKLEEFSKKRIVKECLENKFRPSNGKTYLIVNRFLPSLIELRLKTPKKYSNNEIKMLSPNKSWQLLIPGETNKKKLYKL